MIFDQFSNMVGSISHSYYLQTTVFTNYTSDPNNFFSRYLIKTKPIVFLAEKQIYF